VRSKTSRVRAPLSEAGVAVGAPVLATCIGIDDVGVDFRDVEYGFRLNLLDEQLPHQVSPSQQLKYRL
jgi:hypothetical protein